MPLSVTDNIGQPPKVTNYIIGLTANTIIGSGASCFIALYSIIILFDLNNDQVLW